MERKIELSDDHELNDALELNETELDTVIGGASPQLVRFRISPVNE